MSDHILIEAALKEDLPQDTGWVNVAEDVGADFQVVQFLLRRQGDQVMLIGQVKAPATPARTLSPRLYTLPSGFRAARNYTVLGMSSMTGVPILIEHRISGQIHVRSQNEIPTFTDVYMNLSFTTDNPFP